MRTLLAIIVLTLSLSSTCSAQVIFPNRGGTGTSTIPAAGQVLIGQPNGTYAPMATSALGIVGDSSWTDTGSELQTAAGESVRATYFNATSSTATSSFPRLAVTTAFNLLGSVITNVTDWFASYFDANFATKSTSDLSEGTNLYFTESRTRSAISGASGISYSTSTGVIALDASGNWTGTFEGQEGNWYRDRANQTGSQTASTVSDFTSAAREVFSTTAVGLGYSTSTGVLSLTTGYSIPLSASTTDWQTAFGWGDHSSVGYLSEENDPAFANSSAAGINGSDISNWNAAYSWDDHSLAGYLTSIATTTVRGMFSASAPVTYSTGTGAIGFTNPGYITGVAWGSIAGTLSSQSDLQAALDTKLSTSTAAATYYLQSNPAGFLTGVDWGDINGTLSDQTDLQNVLDGKQATLAVGNLTENISGLEFNNARQVIGGAAQLSLSSGYVIPLSASTTDWTTSFGWGDHASAGYLTTVGPANLSANDFGDFTCNGATCSLDTNSVSDNEIDFSAVTLNDLTFDVGSVSKTEFGYLDGVSSAIQTQLAGLGAIAGQAWTGLHDFGGAVLEITNGTNPTANDPGELAHDTTDNQLILDDIVIARAVQKIWSATVASTSPAFLSGGLLKVPTELDGYTMTAIRCSVQGGTSKVIAVEDEGGNSTEDTTCGTSVTSDDGSINNASVTAAEEMYVDFGATTGAVDYVSISVFGTITRE